METIKEKVNKILTEEFEIPEDKILGDARLKEDLELDSLDAVDMIVCLEEEMGKKIDANLFFKIVTLDDVYKVVEEAINNQ